MHSDAMACEQSGHVAAEDIQELVHAPFLRSSLEMLYPPPYFTSDCGWKSPGPCWYSTGPVCASQRACVRACMLACGATRLQKPIQCTGSGRVLVQLEKKVKMKLERQV